jgi:acyl-coenzyme A thioesterase PaaI-like protein
VSRPSVSPAKRLLDTWRACARLPFGRELFAFVLARMVPYSGTTGALVLTLEKGSAKIALRDRRAVRNHLGSVHAVALTNVGELASGLAMLTALPPGVRGIVRRIETTYHKKARGPLVAESRVAPPAVAGDTDFEVSAVIRDGSGEVVAEVRVAWRLGLVP